MVKEKIKRRIRFILFGTEEIGLVGSTNYVKKHKDEMKNLRFMLNLDSAGGKGRKCVILHHHPELENFIEQAEKEMKTEIPFYQIFSFSGDQWPFILEGVPAASYIGDPELIQIIGGRGFGHTQYDTVDKIKLEYLQLAISNYSRFILRVANTDCWPAKRKKKEDIESLMRKEGLKHPTVLENKVKEYLQKWKEIPKETKNWLKTNPD